MSNLALADTPPAPTIERGGGRPDGGKYITADGRKLPSVTTILQKVIAKPALVAWAYRRGINKLDLYESRDAAADIGQGVHDAVEEYEFSGARPTFEHLRNHVWGEEQRAPREAARLAFEAYLNFRAWQHFEVIALEVPLVSEKLGFAGTLDIMARRDGALALIDLKTSGGIYYEYTLQLAGYARLWEDQRGEQVEHFEIIRTPKDDAPFEHLVWTREEMTPAFDAWDHAFAMFQLSETLSEMVTPEKKKKGNK